MDPNRCGPSQPVRRKDVISTTILLDVSVEMLDVSVEIDATNISTYDKMNISCDSETPNHSNSNSTWIFSIFFR